MARLTDVRSRSRSLFLIATDVAGRVSILAGPYPTIAAAAPPRGGGGGGGGPPARARGGGAPGRGAGGARASATFFGRV